MSSEGGPAVDDTRAEQHIVVRLEPPAEQVEMARRGMRAMAWFAGGMGVVSVVMFVLMLVVIVLLVIAGVEVFRSVV